MLRALLPLAWPILRATAGKPPVNVELRTSWPNTPILLESLESIAIEESGAFFPLLDAVTNPETFPDGRSPRDAHQHVFDTALSLDFLAQPGAYVAAEMHVALHSASPKLEAFYQYYNDHHATRRDDPEVCGSWVDWYGEVVCDGKTLARLVETESLDAPEDTRDNTTSYSATSPKLLPFDHILPDPARLLELPPHTAVLYADLDSANFRELHSYLYAAAHSPAPHLMYVFRPIPSAHRDPAVKTYLSGYGVALDLKKTDYLAVDDRLQGGAGTADDSNAAVQTEEVDPIVTLLQQYPVDESVDVTLPLTEEELLQIDLQAAQFIYDSEDKLSTLKHLAQNFPRYAGALARRVSVDELLLEELSTNQPRARGGVNVAWLNGVTLEEKDLNAFSLLRLLRRERNIMLSLMSLGLSSEQAIELLTHMSIAKAQSESGALDGLFDASDRAEGGGVIGWLNDFENDDRYAHWSNMLRTILRPMYPGQFPTLKRNIFNVVLAVDLSQLSSIDFIASTVQAVIERRMPFRWGVAPLVETEDGARMARLYYYLLQNFGPTETLAFLRTLSQRGTPLQDLSPSVDWSLVRQAFDALLAARDDTAETVETDLDTILEGTEGDLEKQRAYATRLSTTLESASQGHVFFNGKHFELDDNFLRSLQTESAEHLQHIQYKVYKNELTDEDDVSNYFYDLSTTAKRRNMYIHPSPGAGSLRIFSLPDLIERNGLKSSAGSFLYPAESEQVPLTTYVVADFDSEESQHLVKEALLSMTPGSLSRLSFIHNPSTVSLASKSDDFASPSRFLAQLVSWDLLSRLTPGQLLKTLGFGDVDAFSEGSTQEPFSLDDLVGTEAYTGEEYEKYLTACRLVVRQLELKPGEQALIVNGRVVGPMEPGKFVAGDFETLAAYEHHKRVKSVHEALLDVYEPLKDASKEDAAEMTSIASSIVSSIQLPDPSEAGLFNAPQRPRLRNYQMLSGTYTAFSIGDNTTALYHFGVLVDPLSEAAQKWSSLFEWISEIPGVYVEFHVNPTKYNELPLKRFYRYNLLPRLTFDDNGNEVHAKTQFTDLPVEPIYTLAMDTPQSWLIRPREALYDLDNIQLGMLSPRDRTQGLKAVFELDDLVVEGHARESATNAPPRGLQLQLVTSNSTPIADTLVMANLGYVQFRTKPGVYRLEIRPGRGREIFKMESVGNEGWNSPSVEEAGDEVTVTSFEGVTLYPRLARLPGMENVDVLQAHTEVHEDAGLVENLLSKVSSLFGSKQEERALVPVDDGQAEINIFTVASGHLYERFASIMILSVLRHTKSTVKFWFIENFLSPSFLGFIPHFAAEYGFQYELITYKWPSWLRAQKEKQRIIWAYKILFLDVLFPMDLKKVIFVDADQIVRTDLKELVELDLHGAPYGYTPMGDDNPDTEGFRFWKTGYWKDFLRGLPYHISALYVVDLVRFRELAAGDILRGHYQQLSADPNSLANLDQDLPNNLQREVPIFSLPADWLWCETWCSKDRLDRAKTIDLCQNPLTKEPKLDRARQIPEWEVYDSEIAEFTRRLREGNAGGSEVPKHDEL
ncbi:glycosyltransferase family 24 protein [Polyporus arcularius HHB13444]|uniref:Glycosyltransferase family 24 protein n=1 Tax=Polyporus arcularius HHB13444 TaxID=1314778 RepID=A0A5C3P9T2_9APHY|nr:glycosyltransferase family 24 protein [Polyporus arcularius HHB13444]